MENTASQRSDAMRRRLAEANGGCGEIAAKGGLLRFGSTRCARPPCAAQPPLAIPLRQVIQGVTGEK